MKPTDSGPYAPRNSFNLAAAGLRGFFPRNRIELVVFPAHQRLLDAFRVPGEIKTEAPLYAQEFLVDAGEVAVVIGAQNFVIADAQRGLAAVGAVRAMVETYCISHGRVL